jgi:hypothetical protein
MIRFIDLRRQGVGYKFAFFNTVNDKFISFNGTMAWNTKQEFIADCVLNHGEGFQRRFLSLIPTWAE